MVYMMQSVETLFVAEKTDTDREVREKNRLKRRFIIKCIIVVIIIITIMYMTSLPIACFVESDS